MSEQARKTIIALAEKCDKIESAYRESIAALNSVLKTEYVTSKETKSLIIEALETAKKLGVE